MPTDDQKRIVQTDVDLNGIDYSTAILGSFPTAALSYGAWIFTGKAAEYFVTHPVETEFYPVQRLAIAVQTVTVGLSSLAAGIFGCTALGLFFLGLRVAAGVASGELDPTAAQTVERTSTAERVRDFMTQDPVEVALAQRRSTDGRDRARSGANKPPIV